MIQTKKYPAYKDSGVEWLGEIPKGWLSVRMKFLFRDVSQKGKPEEELLSVTQDQGVVPRTWVENRMVMPSGNLESFKFIRKGDFAISLRSFEGGLEYCHHDGIISPAYTVLKKNDELIAAYYKYLFKSSAFISEIQTSVVGIREGKNVSYQILSYSLLPIPSVTEQTAIAAFLDDKTAKIDMAIAQKEKMITLLKERKQIIIQNAVTKGLDPNAKMKPSGVDWIGDIPEGWEVTRLGYYISILSGYAFPSAGFTTEGIRLLRGINVGVNEIRWAESVCWPAEKLTGLDAFFVEKGDIIIGMDRPLIGKGMRVASIEEKDLPCLLLQRVTRLRSTIGLKQEYLTLILQNQDFINYFLPILSGVSVPHISPSQIQAYPIYLPSISEQSLILRHIESQSQKIDAAIALQETQIDKLKEYKATLIDSAVTGKIKVS